MLDTILNWLTWGPIPELATIAIPTYILSSTHKSDNESLKRLASLYSGIGVTFTFVGIYKGLQGFDPNQISESLPIILGGFKTSFTTSILGMFCGMVANVWIDTEYPLIDETDQIIKWLNKKYLKDLTFQETMIQKATETNSLLTESLNQSNDQWRDALVDIIEKLDEKLETRLQTILDSLTTTTSQMLDIVGENHEFQQVLINDRDTQIAASGQLAENSVRAAEGFRSLVDSYLRMEKNAESTGVALEQVADLGLRAKTSSQSMSEFMKSFNDQFTDAYNETITKATEQQAEYLVNVVATILDKIEHKVS
jgi:RNA polymerase-binding transcription factor DksA